MARKLRELRELQRELQRSVPRRCSRPTTLEEEEQQEESSDAEIELDTYEPPETASGTSTITL